MTSNHVLGIKAVLGTGEVVEWGGPSRENIGPDWCGLFNGNEGLFGIALEITLQLLPKAECFHTVLDGYRTLEQAGDAVSAVVASGLLPGAIEIMDALALEAAVAAVHAEYPPGCEAVLIVDRRPGETVAGSGAAGRDNRRSHPVEMRPARAEERLAIWKGRKSAFSAVGRRPTSLSDGGAAAGSARRCVIGQMAGEAGSVRMSSAGTQPAPPICLMAGEALERAEALPTTS
jgi:glycolate oxidase